MRAFTQNGENGRFVYVITSKSKGFRLRSIIFLSYEECVQALINRLKKMKE